MALNPRGGSVEENAAQIVQLPDGTDFARGETGALGVLLTGKPEERDPLKYAEIFRIAAENPSATPWMRFACLAENINGRRRAKGANMPALADELDRLVQQASSELANTDHKYLLLGGVLWNVALVRRGLRRYKEAAAAQRQSSAWYGLAGDVPKQLTGVFAAQVEDVTAAFVSGDVQAIERSVRALIAARDHVVLALPEYPGWMKDNASIHVAWPLAMATAVKLFAWSWTEYLNDFEAAKASRFAQWAQVFRLWDGYTQGKYVEVVGQSPIEIASSSADNAALTVQILRALSERRLGQTTDAENRLRAVAGHQGPDGGVPIAVANQLLV